MKVVVKHTNALNKKVDNITKTLINQENEVETIVQATEQLLSVVAQNTNIAEETNKISCDLNKQATRLELYVKEFQY